MPNLKQYNVVMKNIIIYVIAILFSITQYSQSKEECFANLPIFAEYAKVKNYKAAYQPWVDLKNQCPDLNSAIYVLGERMLKSFIKTSDDSLKLQYQNDLVLEVLTIQLLQQSAWMHKYLNQQLNLK